MQQKDKRKHYLENEKDKSFILFFFQTVLIIIFFLIWVFIKRYKKALGFIADNWCKRPSLKLKYSFLAYGISFCLLIIALLDLRGNPTLTDIKESEGHTIIILDTSLSMLAEDIKPNRMKAAILHLKHYIKSSYNQSFELIVFSDQQKRILAFTDDKELLLTRLSAVESIGTIRGGSDLGLSVKAALTSFKYNGIESGNILIVSDGEFHELAELEVIKKTDAINVAILQTSTEKGGKIPIRSADGRLRFYKKSGRNDIISKPSSKLYEILSNKFSNFKKFVISGYSFNSDAIKVFFNKTNSFQKDKVKHFSRPVYANYMILCSFLLFIVAYGLRMGRSLRLGNFVFFFAIAAEPNLDITEVSVKKLRNGKINYSEVMNLTIEKIKKQEMKDAAVLLRENLSKLNKGNALDHFNHATLLIQSGDLVEGVKKYQDIKKLISKDSSFDELNKNINKNVMIALKSSGGKSSKPKKGKSKQNQNGKKKNQEKKEKDDKTSENKKKKKPSKEPLNIKGIVQQILNDDKKSHEKFLKTQFGKRVKGNKKNDW